MEKSNNSGIIFLMRKLSNYVMMKHQT